MKPTTPHKSPTVVDNDQTTSVPATSKCATDELTHSYKERVINKNMDLNITWNRLDAPVAPQRTLTWRGEGCVTGPATGPAKISGGTIQKGGGTLVGPTWSTDGIDVKGNIEWSVTHVKKNGANSGDSDSDAVIIGDDEINNDDGDDDDDDGDESLFSLTKQVEDDIEAMLKVQMTDSRKGKWKGKAGGEKEGGEDRSSRGGRVRKKSSRVEAKVEIGNKDTDERTNITMKLWDNMGLGRSRRKGEDSQGADVTVTKSTGKKDFYISYLMLYEDAEQILLGPLRR